MFLIPAPDASGVSGARLRVIDPASGRPLPEGGTEVALTPYWRRRLSCGDVLTGAPRRRSKKATNQE
ncbi:DUF2635 domain-containing protein [Lacibacterium aquatile]|uniref:DUF2635 domain-containing protein n=1 Tax=Lacibacterium aquatile TaxID=1168082 RepID=A0ABW5DTC8_9PROT